MNKDINILVVEDEIISCEYLLSILVNLGFKKNYTASSFEESLDIVKNNKIDLIFMDININGSIDGIASAEFLNKEYFIPIIYTTAYGDSQSISEASETNLFAYILKPFDKQDVEASLRVTLKRIKPYLIEEDSTITPKENHIQSLGLNLKYDLDSHTFYENNIAVNLTKKENELLYTLCKNINQNISYDLLIEYVWNNKEISNSTIRDTISRLKKKAPNLMIETIINYGYILRT